MPIALTHKENNHEFSVNVYVRNSMKRAILLTIPQHSPLEVIKENVERRMNVSKESQLLFLHGQLLHHNSLQLQDKSIFHLVNLENVNLASISIKVKRIQPGSQVFEFTIPSTMKITQFIEEWLSKVYSNIEDYFLVYTGRELKFDKTFRDEFVQNNSQILCIHRVQNLSRKTALASSNHRERRKQLEKQNRQREANKEREENTETENLQIYNGQKYSVIRKNNYGQENKNFKKKSRGVVQTEKTPEEGHFVQDTFQSKGYLPFSIISSKFEQEESIDGGKKQSEPEKNSQIMLDSNRKNKIERNEDREEEKIEIKIVDEKQEVQFIQPKSKEIINIQDKGSKLHSSEISNQNEKQSKEKSQKSEERDVVEVPKSEKKVISKKSQKSQTESLLIGSSEEQNKPEQTVKFGAVPTQRQPSTYHSDIMSQPSSKKEVKSSFTFGEGKQSRLTAGSMIYTGINLGNEVGFVMDEIMEGFLERFRQ